MSTKKKSNGKKTKTKNNNKGSQKKKHSYCNILDNLYKTEDGPEIVQTLADICLTNIFTGRAHTKKGDRPRTFMLASGMNKKVDDFKRHMFVGYYAKDGLSKKANSDDPMIYNMIGDGFKVEIKNNDIHIGNAKVEKEIPSHNGMILVISEPLKVSKGGEILLGGNKKVTYTVKDEEELIHPILQKKVVFYDNPFNLTGMDLRWNILEHYRRMWPLYDWSLYDDFNYYNWAYASLIAYLSEQIPNFYTLYEPFPDPLVGLENLLQYRLLDKSGYWMPDSLLQGFVQSPYWLSSDPKIIEKAKIYLGGEARRGNNDELKGGISIPIINQDLIIIQNYLKPFKEELNKILSDVNIPEQKKRMYIIDIYKKIENDDAFRGKDSRNVMKKIGSQVHLVSLGRHLDAFLTYTIKNYITMPMTIGGKSKEIIGGGGSFSVYSPSLFDEIRCLFGNVKYPDLVDLILQPTLTSGYRFNMDFINKFCLSDYCLYVAGLNKSLADTTIPSPYIRRVNFESMGYVPPKNNQPIEVVGDVTDVGSVPSGPSIQTDASKMDLSGLRKMIN
jgi:hypothetical protein